MNRENTTLEEFLAGCDERERDAVVNSYPGRLLDADGLELASVRAYLKAPPWKHYIAYTDPPRSPDSLRDLTPTALVVWDHPSKHVYPIVGWDRCLCVGLDPHFHIVV